MSTSHDDKLRRRRNQKNYASKHPERIRAANRKYSQSLAGRYKSMVKGSSRRATTDKTVTLTFEEYCEVVKDPCFYCNGFFPPVVAGGGIDRMDNNLGYSRENVVSCCWSCNSIKNSILTAEETKEVVSLVVKMRSDTILGKIT